MVAELGGAQISTLLESLPGIATVLRSPVADALVNVIRAAARLSEFDIADADELVKYATSRGLLDEDEGERLMNELKAEHKKKLGHIHAPSIGKALERAFGLLGPSARVTVLTHAADMLPMPFSQSGRSLGGS